MMLVQIVSNATDCGAVKEKYIWEGSMESVPREGDFVQVGPTPEDFLPVLHTAFYLGGGLIPTTAICSVEPDYLDKYANLKE